MNLNFYGVMSINELKDEIGWWDQADGVRGLVPALLVMCNIINSYEKRIRSLENALENKSMNKDE